MFAKSPKVSGNVLLKKKDAKKLHRDVSERALCFTVYAPWTEPGLLLALTVHAPVSEFVLRGADVMLPGVVFSSCDEFQTLQKGELRVKLMHKENIAKRESSEALVCCGEIRCGKWGRKRFQMKDFWEIGWCQLIREDEKDTDVTLEGVAIEEQTQKEDEEMKEVTTEQMDSYYVAPWLQALRTSQIREKELPMLASLFHAKVLLPCRRAGLSLNIKHSSFKKLSVFLRSMEAHGLLKRSRMMACSQLQKFTDVTEMFCRIEPYQTAEEAQQEEQGAADGAGKTSCFCSWPVCTPEVEESVGLSPALKTLLLPDASAGQSLQKYWSIAMIRDLLTQYIESQGLNSQRRSNTTITYIAFYQQFGIDGAAFSKEAQKKWGCRVALQMSENKSKGEEIQIHGQMNVKAKKKKKVG
ncbi:unnamed protein product [Peronospora destructor]|uniref:Eukaryotic translation initiation factor 2D n=1 Tax=Peronospora destructor TaxID=86335 RepID=A0AAV0VGL0_9STRA|nr:unnamed protein product [Peronospora destructor]